MTFTELSKVVSKEFLFRNNGVKVEVDTQGNLYFNGKAATNTLLPSGYTLAVGIVYRYKQPKRVVGVRKRKAALSASLKQYKFSLKYIKG